MFFEAVRLCVFSAVIRFNKPKQRSPIFIFFLYFLTNSIRFMFGDRGFQLVRCEFDAAHLTASIKARHSFETVALNRAR